MAIKGLTLSSTIRYQSNADPAKGTDDATTFILKPLDVFVQTAVFDAGVDIRDNTENPLKMYRMNLETVRFGLSGWEKFEDDKGNQLAFETVKLQVSGREYSVISGDLLKVMPFSLVRELAEQIRELSVVRESEAKN